ncbi:MAG: cation-translocating P-type ATPase [Planctomycetes bacterium]|nr:cation-translocating P-type ATPase [Planctomycetota bacterium]
MSHQWHALSAEQTLEALQTGERGLTASEAARRLARHGPNELAAKERQSVLVLFLDQFKNVLILMLLAAVGLSLLLGEYVDAVVILVIVLLATLLGFIQEYRAERALDKLKELAAPNAGVLRDGRIVTLPARELVPGDVIQIKTGDRVPADARLLSAINLRVEEASLTGESAAAEKTGGVLEGAAQLGDRRNMAYTGTNVVYGRGSAVVVATGMATEFGRIAGLLAGVEKRMTPLQAGLDRMAKHIAIGAVALIVPLVCMGVARGHGWAEMFVWGVSLAVAAVPEALAAVVTIGLAIGLQRMIKRRALVRKLPAVETLGCTDVICSDKTGTLTQDRMTGRRVFVSGRAVEVSGAGDDPLGCFAWAGAGAAPASDPALALLLEASALCNDSTIDGDRGGFRGDPTEIALAVLAAKGGCDLDSLRREFPRVAEVPFSSETKRMTTVHGGPRGRIVFCKGAPEVIIEQSVRIRCGSEERPLDAPTREELLAVNGAMAEDALRVLAIAYKSDDGGPPDAALTFLGLAGMIDPPRPEAAEAIRTARGAGVRSVMITGDNKNTAARVARELGLLAGGLVVEGRELDGLSAAELDALVPRADVYARVSPVHKLAIVEALQRRGHVVAMTGDGINDAPALKQADIGVAMGATGTDVSKEAADMVLIDDNFASIVAAIEEGRGVFDNIKKFLVYLLSCNLGEVLLMAAGILFGSLVGLTGGALPLVAIQILYVNLATDGLPAVALSLNPKEADLMRRRPRRRTEGIFTPQTIARIASLGVWTCLVGIAALLYARSQGNTIAEAQAFCFVTLILVQLVNALNCRSLSRSIFSVGVFSNRWLLLALLWEGALLCLIVYLPPLQEIFHTYAFSGADWCVAVLLAASILAVSEAAKLARRLCFPATPRG